MSTIARGATAELGIYANKFCIDFRFRGNDKDISEFKDISIISINLYISIDSGETS